MIYIFALAMMNTWSLTDPPIPQLPRKDWKEVPNTRIWITEESKYVIKIYGHFYSLDEQIMFIHRGDCGCKEEWWLKD